MKANCDGAVSRQLLTITLMEELWCKGEMAQQIKPSQFVSVCSFLCLLFCYSSLLLYSALSLLQSFFLCLKLPVCSWYFWASCLRVYIPRISSDSHKRFHKPFHRAVGSHVKDPTNNIFTVDQSKQFNVSVKVIEIQLTIKKPYYVFYKAQEMSKDGQPL